VIDAVLLVAPAVRPWEVAMLRFDFVMNMLAARHRRRARAAAAMPAVAAPAARETRTAIRTLDDLKPFLSRAL